MIMAASGNESPGGYRVTRSGKSLGAVPAVQDTAETASRPSYSGGGKNCLVLLKDAKMSGDASMSDASLHSVGSARSAGTSRSKKAPKRRKEEPIALSSSGSESVLEDGVEGKQKRREFLKDRKEVAETALEERAQIASENRASLKLLLAGEDDVQTTEALSRIVLNDVALVAEVATKSRNMKGTLQRALKDSALSIKAVMDVLLKKNTADENARLLADNVRLQGEISAVRKEMAELRKEVAKVAKASPTQPIPSPVRAEVSRPLPVGEGDRLEELMRSVMVQVGTMVNARLEAFAERLPPEKRLRPPLEADRKNAAAAVAAQGPATSAKPAKTAAAPKSRKGPKGKGDATKVAPKKAAPRPLPPAPESMDLGWSTVVKRGAKKKAATQSQPTVAPAKPRGQSAPAKLRPPRSAAVVIKLQPGAVERGVTYAGAMRVAREKVDLDSCGIEWVRFRKAATGACMLEVSGAASGEKADLLAQKLRDTIGEIATVSRPTKTVDLRVSGLDDSVSAEEVVAAVVRRGGCPRESVTHGEMRFDSRGIGSLFLRCPVAAAKRLEGARLLVGWLSAQVRVLEARPRRCFRCLQTGHVRALCTSAVDRSDECYRCGLTGHKAAKCCAPAAKCSLCTAANRPAQHRLGSKSCCPPKPKRGPKAAVPAVGAPVAPSRLPQPEGGEEAMICN